MIIQSQIVILFSGALKDISPKSCIFLILYYTDYDFDYLPTNMIEGDWILRFDTINGYVVAFNLLEFLGFLDV